MEEMFKKAENVLLLQQEAMLNLKGRLITQANLVAVQALRRIDKQADRLLGLQVNHHTQPNTRTEDNQDIECIKTAMRLVTQHQKQREVMVER